MGNARVSRAGDGALAVASGSGFKSYFFRIGIISVWIGCPVTSMSLFET